MYVRERESERESVRERERERESNTEREQETERERQISYDITYMGKLKKKWYKWTYLQNRNRLTDLENKLIVTKEERWGGGIN